MAGSPWATRQRPLRGLTADGAYPGANGGEGAFPNSAVQIIGRTKNQRIIFPLPRGEGDPQGAYKAMHAPPKHGLISPCNFDPAESARRRRLRGRSPRRAPPEIACPVDRRHGDSIPVHGKNRGPKRRDPRYGICARLKYLGKMHWKSTCPPAYLPPATYHLPTPPCKVFPVTVSGGKMAAAISSN